MTESGSLWVKRHVLFIWLTMSWNLKGALSESSLYLGWCLLPLLLVLASILLQDAFSMEKSAFCEWLRLFTHNEIPKTVVPGHLSSRTSLWPKKCTEAYCGVTVLLAIFRKWQGRGGLKVIMKRASARSHNSATDDEVINACTDWRRVVEFVKHPAKS